VRESDEQIWHMYERDLDAEGKTAATVRNYRQSLSQLSDSLPDDADLLSASHEQIAAWLAELKARVTSLTRSQYMARARVFYAHMIDAGYHEGPHPMRGLAKIKPDHTIMRCPADDEVIDVITACMGKTWYDLRDMAILRILCEAGTPRGSEMAAIRLDDVDLRHDCITIRGKGGLERVIHIGAKSCRAITLWLRKRKTLRLGADPRTKDLLFFSKYGPMDNTGVRKIIEQRARKAALAKPLTTHAFRRYTYDAWEKAGGHPGAAMPLWGWRTATMPVLYGEANAGRRAVKNARTMSLGDSIPV
jgi:integrase/recombinase XerD